MKSAGSALQAKCSNEQSEWHARGGVGVGVGRKGAGRGSRSGGGGIGGEI